MGRSLKVSPDNIKRVKDAVKRNGYTSQNAFIKATGICSKSTYSNFFRGKPIDFDYFAEICDKLGLDWQEISSQETNNQPTELPLPLTYEKDTWVGREETLIELKLKLQEKIRLLVITGLTGQGKTALGEKLTRDLRQDGKWHYLNPANFDDATTPKDFVGFAGKLLTELGEELNPESLNNAQFLFNKLIAKLRHRAYLLQFDSLEVLLQGNDFVDSWWEEFFNSFLANSQSRFILTSQVFPRQLYKRYKEFLGEYQLPGLGEKEQWQLWQKLFSLQGKELQRDSLPGQHLQQISKVYEGHPLVIKVIAGEILDAYQGDVSAYYQRYEEEFTVIERSDTHEGLENKVRARVKVALARLKKEAPTAYSLLLRSSVFRLAVVADFWLGMLPGVKEREKKRGRNVLESRCLVIEEGNLLRQHNLIRSTASSLLQEEEDWQEVHKQAARLWLQDYEADAEAENLVKVQGYLEAFYHFCEIEAWEEASEILAIKMDTPTQEDLDNQLGTWGLYRQQIDLYSQLLNKLDDHWQGICLTGLGNAYYSLGDYHQAIDYHQQRLTIAQQIGNRNGEGSALGNLGIAYHSLGDYHQAIKYHQQHLTIAQQIGDRNGEGNALGNLGIAYHSLGDYHQAIKYHQQSLTIFQQIGDRNGEGNALGNLGIAYDRLGDYHQAIDYHQQHLTIAQQIGDRNGEGTALGNLGIAYDSLGDYHQAIDYHQQHLTIAQQIGDRNGEGTALGNLGIAYDSLGDYHQAIDYHQQHLTIAQQIGDRNGEGNALGSLGNAYDSLGDYHQAIDYLQQRLTIAQQIGDRNGEGIALANLGNTYYKLEDYSQSQQYSQAALAIFRQTGFKYGEATVLNNLARINEKLGNLELAKQQCQQALEIATELGIPLVKECQELQEKLGS